MARPGAAAFRHRSREHFECRRARPQGNSQDPDRASKHRESGPPLERARQYQSVTEVRELPFEPQPAARLWERPARTRPAPRDERSRLAAASRAAHQPGPCGAGSPAVAAVAPAQPWQSPPRGLRHEPLAPRRLPAGHRSAQPTGRRVASTARGVRRRSAASCRARQDPKTSQEAWKNARKPWRVDPAREVARQAGWNCRPGPIVPTVRPAPQPPDPR